MRHWARLLWRTALGGLHAALILACGLVFAAVVLLWRPELALTPPLLARAVQELGAAYHPRWTAFDLRLTSESWTLKRLTLRARGFCVDDSSGALKACFESLDADVSLRLSTRGVAIDRVRRLDARGRSAELDLERLAAASPPRRRRHYRPLNAYVPRLLRRIRLDEADVRLPDTEVRTGSATISGDYAIRYSSSLAFSAQLYYDTPAKGENVDVDFTADSDLFTTGRLTWLRAKGSLDGDVDDHARFEATAKQTARRKTAVDARLRFESGPRRLTAKLKGEATPALYSGRLSALLSDASSPLRELALAPCDFRAPFDQGALQGIKASCRLEASPPPFGAAPKKLAGTAALDLKMKPRPLQPDRFEATVRVVAAPPKDWYDVRGELDAALAGQLGELPESLSARHDLKVTVTVARFQDLVAYLRGTAYAVPAPLHVMTGPLTATLSSRGDPRAPDQEFVYRANADLTSGRQKARLRVDGRLLAKRLFEPARRVEDRTTVALEDVALELPYLKLGKIPSMTTDPRIRTGEEPAAPATPAQAPAAPAPKAPPFPLDYEVAVKSVKPVVLFTNLNPQPIPLAVDLTARPAGVAGTIDVQPFVATLFKRQGHVDHVTLTAQPGSRALRLDGLIKFHDSAADVSLFLLGNTDKPRVFFESDPPMDEQQIIALLVFGKPPDELDPEQTTTVANSESAMATGAFGLASLYLFASTPVQYVGYDPGTQTYAMRFSLPGGASLEVGSASDQSKHLTLRKRLARHWVIETELQRDPEQQRNAISTFLEWFQRY